MERRIRCLGAQLRPFSAPESISAGFWGRHMGPVSGILARRWAERKLGSWELVGDSCTSRHSTVFISDIVMSALLVWAGWRTHSFCSWDGDEMPRFVVVFAGLFKTAGAYNRRRYSLNNVCRSTVLGSCPFRTRLFFCNIMYGHGTIYLV